MRPNLLLLKVNENKEGDGSSEIELEPVRNDKSTNKSKTQRQSKAADSNKANCPLA